MDTLHKGDDDDDDDDSNNNNNNIVIVVIIPLHALDPSTHSCSISNFTLSPCVSSFGTL